MRILGYSKHWPKLHHEHTTFRFPRKDAPKGRDWHEGETVCEVVCPRASHASGKREVLGPAPIVTKKRCCMGLVTDAEAVADGFETWEEMWSWMQKAHPSMTLITTLNKLTLKVMENPEGIRR